MNKGEEESKVFYWWDLIAFCGALVIAYFLNWQTSDLIWSLWLGSLMIGYLTILSGILGGMWKSLFPRGEGGVPLPKLLMQSLFLLVFFTFHFGVFHFVHSIFLKQFFPLDGGGSLSSMNGNPLLAIKDTLSVLIPRYGVFLIPTIIAQRFNLLAPFKADTPDPNEKEKKKSTNMMAAPYKNVIKMHMMIFFFLGCSFLKLEGFLVYAVVYFVFFFPMEILRKKKA